MNESNSTESHTGTSGNGGCPIHRLFHWDPTQSKWSRVSIFLFGALAYFTFLSVILYAIGFTAKILVPKHIDSGTPGEVVPSLLINSGLLMVFVIQHTVMARPRFKLWLSKFLPPAIERSIFVMLSNIIFIAIFWFWQPLPETVWHIESTPLVWLIYAIAAIGWVIVFASTFMLSHFDLLGFRQVVFNARGRSYQPVPFQRVWLYKVVRHPLMLGFIIAFWATPTMSQGHLFFAIMTTGYIVFGTWVEERDLRRAFGDSYRSYQREVRGLIPLPKRQGGNA